MKTSSLGWIALVLGVAGCGGSQANEAAPLRDVRQGETEAAPAEAPPAQTSAAAPERPYLLERVGDVGIVQTYVDHFEELPLNQQILAYHLYRASIAGDRIAYDQRYAHNLEIKDLFEALIRTNTATPAMIVYTKQLWIHHGVHNMRTSRKFVPSDFTADDLTRVAHAARAAGASELGATDAEVDAKLTRLRRAIFDANFEPMCTSKSPARGQDIVSASFNTFYPGLRLADLRNFHDQFPLNSRVVRERGRLVEQVYRTGDGTVAEGLYAPELRGVIHHLNLAMSVAPEAQRNAWQHLVQYFRTGDNNEFRQYNIAWVQDDPAVDAILGFIESYTDARGTKGLWEGITFYRNDARTGLMRAIAQNAPYFEGRTPWDAQYRKTEFRPLVASTVDVLLEDGDGGPISAAGINLPNEQAIREQHGSRNFFLNNIIESGNLAVGPAATREFAASDEEGAIAERCVVDVWNAMVTLHEVTGHASGRVSADLHGDPHEHLRQYYSTLEEARADLVALWHMSDPKVMEVGLLHDAACVPASYRLFAANFLSSLRRYTDGNTLEEDHDRARSMIVNFARDRGAVVAEQRDGHWYLRVPNPDAFRVAIGELLSELQRIKATGDFAAIQRLVEQFGTHIDDAWRADAIARAARLNLPTQWAYVSSRLVPVMDAEHNITDVRVERPESFQAYMLELSALSRDSVAAGSSNAAAAPQH